jgi:hypothetical protein
MVMLGRLPVPHPFLPLLFQLKRDPQLTSGGNANESSGSKPVVPAALHGGFIWELAPSPIICPWLICVGNVSGSNMEALWRESRIDFTT